MVKEGMEKGERNNDKGRVGTTKGVRSRTIEGITRRKGKELCGKGRKVKVP